MMRKLLFLVPAFVLTASAHAAEGVVNGNFETPNSTAWLTNYDGMIKSWFTPGTSGKSLYLGYGGMAGSYGIQFVDLSKFGKATLSFDLTVIAHGAPETSYMAIGLGYDNEVARYYFGSDIDGQLTTTHITVALTNPVGFLPNAPLVFGSGHHSDSTGIWVDNVSIKAQPVPEPATMAALGLGSLGVIRRRRK